MKIKKLTLTGVAYPKILRGIYAPPKQLFITGSLEKLMLMPRVAIVGSRSITPYGKQITIKLARDLAQQGVVIVSGLAIGVDHTAHHAALEAGGRAIAVLPSPLDDIVPRSSRPLAERILAQDGALVSEYESGQPAYKQNFIARNRIVSGLADALLITEASDKSGSLHTARFALEQGKTIMAVPGNINSLMSAGTNNLIASGQAQAITSYADVLHVLGIQPNDGARLLPKGRNHNEQLIIDVLSSGISAGEELLKLSHLKVSEFNQALIMLEIAGKIRSLGANHWCLA